jgi:cellulose synthase/poly-beta-1,6-N-acetylglucosamine synthase-like glycosyltransferase
MFRRGQLLLVPQRNLSGYVIGKHLFPNQLLHQVRRSLSMNEPRGQCALTVLVLTLNEAVHIRRCIESVRDVACRVVVVDSGSTDRTCEIARELGADVFANPFTTHAKQLNWGLDNAGVSTQWVMKLDADEYLTP